MAATLDTLARSIASYEGYEKRGTLAQRQNNPGNLKFVGQKDSVRGDNGFARFKTPNAGWSALHRQIRLDSSRGLTLERFMTKYAPPTENNTSAYLRALSRSLGIDPKTPLSSFVK